MIHLGDCTKINGAEIEPVDCITFGSPCQDLSVAGKRAGLAGERSGLFIEAVRIIKEMRKSELDKLQRGWSDEHIRPVRFGIWENVPGAFSSNGGEDFRCVLEELARVKQPNVVIPRPLDQKGKPKRWDKYGYIFGDGWSLAWRTMDAQYWGVPQRRKRICVLCDFDGYTAGELLLCDDFQPIGETYSSDRIETVMDTGRGCRSKIQLIGKGLPRNLESCCKAWKGIAENPERCTGECGTELSQTLQIRSGCDGGGKGALIQNERTGALSTVQDKTLFK